MGFFGVLHIFPICAREKCKIDSTICPPLQKHWKLFENCKHRCLKLVIKKLSKQSLDSIKRCHLSAEGRDGPSKWQWQRKLSKMLGPETIVTKYIIAGALVAIHSRRATQLTQLGRWFAGNAVVVDVVRGFCVVIGFSFAIVYVFVVVNDWISRLMSGIAVVFACSTNSRIILTPLSMCGFRVVVVVVVNDVI